ncbi:hypothetical protein [Sphingobium baderi]|uniref:hypothetical protein n=1 Tax=Sphingobium baderi TaxID=1332080 RepID=UPI0012E3832C|nr:hypothetical protein [Sphingobium baderi]
MAAKANFIAKPLCPLGRRRREDKTPMKAFLKSDLFFRFLGGFVLGAIGMFAFHQEEPSMIAPSAIAAPAADYATR